MFATLALVSILSSVDVPVQSPTSTPWYEHVSVFGFARAGVFYTFPFQDDQLVGSRGGFRLMDMRLGVSLKPIDKLEVVVSIDGAVPKLNSDDPLSGDRVVALKDGYVDYDICHCATIRVGQFKAPFWAEALQNDAQLSFVTRSVVSRGINPPEAYGPRDGLSLDRQIGIQLASKRLGSSVGFRYALAVVNGNGANQLFNDNNMVTPVARVQVDLYDHVALAINGYYNPTTFGVRPNRIDANNLGYGLDVTANLGNIDFLAGFIGRRTSYSYGLPIDHAFGALGQLHYLHERTGLEVAVRVAMMDPSSAQDDDWVMESALMLGWRPVGTPLRLMLQYTNRTEQAKVSYPNDSLDAMLAVTW